MATFAQCQAEYDAQLPPEYDDYEGYCDICDRYDDEHEEDCENEGTTESERYNDSKQAYEEDKAEATYEKYKEDMYDIQR